MSLARYPTEQFPSSHFLISGRSILSASIQAPRRVCLIYHKRRGEWFPKGRKDRGENVTAAAVRETFDSFDSTFFRYRLLSCRSYFLPIFRFRFILRLCSAPLCLTLRANVQ